MSSPIAVRHVMPLLAVPNVSEGRDQTVVAAVGARFQEAGARLLDVHVDPDHNRSVFTLAGEPGALARALVTGAAEAVARIDMRRHDGVHPCVGALDVAPIVHLDGATRGAACAEALVTADELARTFDLPVFLYGALAGGRTRAELRRGGSQQLAQRIAGGELVPDFGPARAHPHAGATLVAARPPLVAFNLVLAAPATLADAESIARAIRDGAPAGLPGVRAIGLWLAGHGAPQVSCNVEDPAHVPLRDVVAAVRRYAPIETAELVGLAPRAAFEGFPDDTPVAGFDPARHLLENALA
jgi:glutamate formiminotransferase/glutamate formiminotransferase/formiminotetrahydrofolate cyclodeaminase